MSKLSQNLTITYSNQRARDLKSTASLNPLDKVVTLDGLIVELFEQNNFQIILDDVIGASIVYKIIQEHHIEYFGYLQSDAESLQTIYSFIVKCNRNDVVFDTLINGDKLEAIEQINTHYQSYKKSHSIVDIADVEAEVLRSWSEVSFVVYSDIFIDDFIMGDICFIKSKKQEQILEKLNKCKKLEKTALSHRAPKIIQPSNVVFDAIDEVKTALKIARKLLEEGVSAEEILIVASDIAEYAPLFKLFLSEYGLQGYSSLGTPLSSYHQIFEPRVQKAMDQYKSHIQSLEVLYKKLGLTLSATAIENIKASMKILDEKIGIELTEPNQLVGLHRTYKHIVFIGTDINHFPPSAKDNFLYTYDNDVQYFYANNYFTSSQTQLYELKRVSENLYIITASYSGKRELKPSILLDGRFDDMVDISKVQSISELGLNKQTIAPEGNTKAYYESITGETWSKFDGNEVKGIEAARLSASQINKYLSCPLAYFYANKLGVKAPRQTQEGFDVMEQGSLMHLCYELFGKKIKASKSTSLDKEALYALMYDTSIEAYKHKQTVEPRGKEKLVENIHHQIFLSNLQAGLKDERDVGLLAKFVDYYIQNAEAFEYFQNTEFEKAFALDAALKPYVKRTNSPQYLPHKNTLNLSLNNPIFNPILWAF